MSCEALREWVWTAADGGLSAEQQALLDLHLASCASCREAALRARRVTAGLRELRVGGPTAAPAELRDATLAALDAAVRVNAAAAAPLTPRLVVSRWRKIAAPLALAAATAVAAVIWFQSRLLAPATELLAARDAASVASAPPAAMTDLDALEEFDQERFSGYATGGGGGGSGVPGRASSEGAAGASDAPAEHALEDEASSPAILDFEALDGADREGATDEQGYRRAGREPGRKKDAPLAGDSKSKKDPAVESDEESSRPRGATSGSLDPKKQEEAPTKPVSTDVRKPAAPAPLGAPPAGNPGGEAARPRDVAAPAPTGDDGGGIPETTAAPSEEAPGALARGLVDTSTLLPFDPMQLLAAAAPHVALAQLRATLDGIESEEWSARSSSPSSKPGEGGFSTGESAKERSREQAKHVADRDNKPEQKGDAKRLERSSDDSVAAAARAPTLLLFARIDAADARPIVTEPGVAGGAREEAHESSPADKDASPGARADEVMIVDVDEAQWQAWHGAQPLTPEAWLARWRAGRVAAQTAGAARDLQQPGDVAGAVGRAASADPATAEPSEALLSSERYRAIAGDDAAVGGLLDAAPASVSKSRTTAPSRRIRVIFLVDPPPSPPASRD